LEVISFLGKYVGAKMAKGGQYRNRANNLCTSVLFEG